MGDFIEHYKHIDKEIQKRRSSLIAKWKAKGCSDNKIQELIYRRINSKKQYW